MEAGSLRLTSHLRLPAGGCGYRAYRHGSTLLAPTGAVLCAPWRNSACPCAYRRLAQIPVAPTGAWAYGDDAMKKLIGRLLFFGAGHRLSWSDLKVYHRPLMDLVSIYSFTPFLKIGNSFSTTSPTTFLLTLIPFALTATTTARSILR